MNLKIGDVIVGNLTDGEAYTVIVQALGISSSVFVASTAKGESTQLSYEFLQTSKAKVVYNVLLNKKGKLIKEVFNKLKIPFSEPLFLEMKLTPGDPVRDLSEDKLRILEARLSQEQFTVLKEELWKLCQL